MSEAASVPGHMYTQYDNWELTPPTLPSRSHLYHLEPIGVGTAQVESLTGYIARLAEAHCVTVRHLMTEEIVPLLGRAHLLKKTDNSLSAFWSNEARPLNGMARLAHDGVAVLSQLALRNDLKHLTLLNWRMVLSSQRFLRNYRAWCPCCYQDWRERGEVVYEPYLWLFSEIEVCVQHRCCLKNGMCQ